MVFDQLLNVRPRYDYGEVLATPEELGSCTSAKCLGKNMEALMAYVKVIITSNTKANPISPIPLGDSYFKETAGQCTLNGEKVSRYIYVQNQPDPRYSVIRARGQWEPNGLMPGILTNIIKANPVSLFLSMSQSGDPTCVQTKLKVTPKFTPDIRDGKVSKVKYETKPITEYDAKQVDPCQFEGEKNPYTNETCSRNYYKGTEGFINQNDNNFLKLYYTSLGIIGIYLLYCFIHKHNH